VESQLRFSSEPVVRVLVFSLVGVALSTVSFGSGWFLRYAVREGIPATVERLHERLESSIEALRKYPFFDRVFTALLKNDPENLGFELFHFTGPERARPRPTRSTKPLPSPAPTASAAAPSVRPSVRPKPSARSLVSSVRVEVSDYIAHAAELSPQDKQPLLQLVSKWGNVNPEDILILSEKVDKLVYVKDVHKRPFLVGLFQLPGVLALLKLEGSDAADKVERIVMGWDVSDLRKAFNKNQLAGLHALSSGRPDGYFLGLAKEYGPFKGCLDNLKELAEGKARVTVQGATTQGSSPGRPGVAVVQCASGGRYEQRPEKVWRCSVHGSLLAPFGRAVYLMLYHDPIERALKLDQSGQSEQALTALAQVLRLYPNQILAVNAVSEVYFHRKDWFTLREYLTPWIARYRGNARWLFMLAVASHAVGDVEKAKQFATAAQKASYSAPPPNFSTLKEFYLVKDRVKDVLDAASKGIRWGDYEFRNIEEYPSSQCARFLGDIRDEIVTFAARYPKNHPDLAIVKAKQAKLAQIVKNLKPGPGMAQTMAKVKAKEKELEERVNDILGDTDGRRMWKAMARSLSVAKLNSCPSQGRYTIDKAEWLECGEHPGIFPERVTVKTRTRPTREEEALLSRAILTGVLSTDLKRKACFGMQRDFINSRGTAGVQPGEITSSTTLPTGVLLRCPLGGQIKAEARTPGSTRVWCSYHGSFEEYFSGFAETSSEEGR